MATLNDLYKTIASHLAVPALTGVGINFNVSVNGTEPLSIAITNLWRTQLQLLLAERKWAFNTKTAFISKLIGVDYDIPTGFLLFELPVDFEKFLFFSLTQTADSSINFNITRISPRGQTTKNKVILVADNAENIIKMADDGITRLLGITYIPSTIEIEDLPSSFFQYLCLKIALLLEPTFSTNIETDGSLVAKFADAKNRAESEEKQNDAIVANYDIGYGLVDKMLYMG